MSALTAGAVNAFYDGGFRLRRSASWRCLLGGRINKAIEVRHATANPKVQILRTSLRLRGITTVTPLVFDFASGSSGSHGLKPRSSIGSEGVEELECDEPFEFLEERVPGRCEWTSARFFRCFHESGKRVNRGDATQTDDSSVPRKPWRPFRLTGAFFLWGKIGMRLVRTIRPHDR